MQDEEIEIWPITKLILTLTLWYFTIRLFTPRETFLRLLRQLGFLAIDHNG
jgi:hypothetical protein